MKKRKWLAASVCSFALVASLGAAIGTSVIARASGAQTEKIADIAETCSAFFDLTGSEPALKDVTVASGENVFYREDATSYFGDNHGIKFKAKSSGQWADDKGIYVYFGGVDIIFSALGNDGLVVYVDNNVESWNRLNMDPNDPANWDVAGYRLASFDETQEHTYAVSRVKSENGHTINVYLDGQQLGHYVENKLVAAESPHGFYGVSDKGDPVKSMFVKNNGSGCDITFSSTYSSYAELSAVYGEEQATDIAELNGDVVMALGGERTYAATGGDEWPLDKPNGTVLLSGGTLDMSKNHGVIFKMKANGAWGEGDPIFRVDLGGTNVMFVRGSDGSTTINFDENIDSWRRNASYSVVIDETKTTTYRITKSMSENGCYIVRVYLTVEGGAEKLVAIAADAGATMSDSLSKITVISAKAAGGFSLKSTIENFKDKYLDETATDIYDLTGNNAMKTAKGADYLEWNFLRAENGKDIYGNTVLGDADGIEMKMKWAELVNDDFYLRVYLGGTQVRIERWGGSTYFYIAENLSAGGEVQETQIAQTYIALDLTQEHTYKITRAKEKSGDKHLVRVYVDGGLVHAGISDAAMQKAGDWDWGCVRVENVRYWGAGSQCRQDATVTIKSCDADPVPAFENEKNVNDLFDMSNDATLLTRDGKIVPSGNVTHTEWIRSAVNDTDGIEFAIQTDATNQWDLVKIVLGSMDIRLNLHGGDLWFFVYGWSNVYGGDGLGVCGSEFYTGKRIDATKHTVKITRCKAVETNGYNVDIYWDGASVVSAYLPIALTNADSNGITVTTAAAVTFYSCLDASEVLPAFETEKCNDILYYGGDITNLLSADGKTMKNEEAILYSSEWMDGAIVKERLGTNGIEFKMKASSAWADGYDKIQLLMGFTDVRFNIHGGKLHAHVYNWGSTAPHEGLWGFEHYLGDFDMTAEHTVKITRRLATNGKGLSVRIYLDGDMVCETYEPYASAYSNTEQFRRIVALRNTSGVDITFKSGFDRSAWNFEEQVVNDLFAVKNHNREVYNESALSGVTVPLGNRIINNVWDEEFASVSNGLEFKIKPATEGQSWKTSGNAKIYVAAQEGDDGAVKGTDGKWYKPTSQAWTSAWGNTWNVDTWIFPGFYRDEEGRICDWNTHEVLDAENDLAFRYHLNVDWGTIRLQCKLTPAGQLVVRQFSRYSGAVVFEGVVMEHFDSSIEHTVKMARVREKTSNGFVTRLWIDDMQNAVMETYDPSPLGRSGDVFSHFLLDNITGIDIAVTNVRTLDDVKTDAKKLYGKAESDYSANYWAQVQEIVNAADAEMETLESLKAIKSLAELTAVKVNVIWTKEVEAQFVTAKSDAESSLNGAVSGKVYNEPEQTKITDLLAAGKAEIEAAVDFRQLEVVTQIWLNRLGAVKTTEQLAALNEARETAVGLLNGYFAQFAEADYSAANYSEIGALKETYAALIADATEEDEIAALPLMAKTEMLAVKTTAQVTFESVKNNSATEIGNYVNTVEYSADNRLLAESIIAEAQQKISTAASEEEIAGIVAAAKLQLDGLEKASAPVPEASAFERWGWIVLVCVLAAAVAVAVPVTVVFVRKKKGRKDEE